MGRTSWLVCILAFAFLFRAAIALGVQHHLDGRPGEDFLIAGDAAGYWELGRKLARGEDFSLYEPPRYTIRMPGFPLWLAVPISVFGDSFLMARLWLAGVGALACGLVYWLGKELFDAETGLLAAGLTAVSPMLAGFSVLILSETLFAVCLVLSLIAMAKLTYADPTPRPTARGAGTALLAGVLIALACYVRPSWLLAAPLFAAAYVVLARYRTTAWLYGALVVAGTVGALLPWAIRNQHVTGHFVLTTLWLGPSLYDGLNPAATGESDMAFFDQDNLMQHMSEYEVDRHYRRQAWEFVKANPGRTLALGAEKFRRFWNPWPNAPQFQSLVHRLAVATFFVPMIVLAARGWWITRRKPWSWLLTLSPILYFAALHVVFIGSLRYRLPAEYPLWILAAAGLRSLWRD